jgi:predicted RNA methylase
VNFDQVYTPPDLAKALVSLSELEAPIMVADYAAGEGALLREAGLRWPNASLFANDICTKSIDALRTRFPFADVTAQDFLDERVIPNSKQERNIDLAILNPPFSTPKGFRTNHAVVSRSSRPAAFLLKAADLASVNGEVLAIMPKSFVKSELDLQVRDYLRSTGELDFVSSYKSAFSGHSVSVVLVKYRKTHNSQKFSDNSSCSDGFYEDLTLVRGSLSVHRAKRVLARNCVAGPRYIHTTNLKDGNLVGCCRLAEFRQSKLVEGSGLLLPRVGRPNPGKIVRVRDLKYSVLSDCVIYMTSGSANQDDILHSFLIENEDVFYSLYDGSCAPYTTLRRIRETIGRSFAL